LPFIAPAIAGLLPGALRLTLLPRGFASPIFQDPLDRLAVVRTVGGDCRVGSLLTLLTLLFSLRTASLATLPVARLPLAVAALA
jgi:hypothetical protein